MMDDWKRTLFTAALAALLAGGCNLLPGGDDDDDDDDLERDRDLPRDARVVREGREELSWTADRDGRVYLYDTTERKLLHNAPIRDGDKYRINPEEDEIEIEGRDLDVHMSDDNKHAIYFLPEGRRSSDRDDRDIGRGRVPDSARVVAEGRGRELRYRADDEGTIYLWDNTDDRLLNTFKLDRGEVLEISPNDDRAELNGRVIVRDLDLSDRHEYRLLFDRR